MTFKNSKIKSGRCAGILLAECMVYIAVFAVLLGVATASFYACWDHTKLTVGSSEDIAVVLHAGERWREDIRNATGKLTIETHADGEIVKIPQVNGKVIYRFGNNDLTRESSGANGRQLLMTKVKSSQMVADTRHTIEAWRWELELKPRRKKSQQSMLFTFEAVRANP